MVAHGSAACPNRRKHGPDPTGLRLSDFGNSCNRSDAASSVEKSSSEPNRRSSAPRSHGHEFGAFFTISRPFLPM